MTTSHRRYAADPLAGDWKAPRGGRATPVEATSGLVVEDVDTGWCGAVVRVEKAGGMHVVHLEDRRGKVKGFPLGPGFLLDGKPVLLTPPTAAANAKLAQARKDASRTASGSRAVAGQQARVARGSRIFVEGRHDAELVEKVWGHDLRVDGVVVEYLEGVDHLAALLDAEPPASDRRYGVLVDHLVAGSKESRIAEGVARGRYGAHVRIVGHPFIDVWQCVKPAAVGIARWPEVPRGIEWKVGVCRALGWPAEDQADIAAAWQRILAGVHTYRDLEPALLGRVEELIDFVTA